MKPHAKRQTTLWLIVIGFCLAVGLGILLFILPIKSDINSTPAQPAISLVSPTPATQINPKATAQAQLENEHLTLIAVTPPAGATKPPIPTSDPRRTPVLPPSTPAGSGKIIESGFGGPYGSSVLIKNQWWLDMGTMSLHVYAGAKRSDGAGFELPRPWQGLVIVAVWGSDPTYPLVESGWYDTPIKDGLVSMVDAQGTRLILRSENGTTFYFDVPARQFVSSLTEVVPTATPIPPILNPTLAKPTPTPPPLTPVPAPTRRPYP